MSTTPKKTNTPRPPGKWRPVAKARVPVPRVGDRLELHGAPVTVEAVIREGDEVRVFCIPVP